MTMSLSGRSPMGLLAIVAVVSCASPTAADPQSIQSGNWSDPNIWSTGRLPDASDAVTISAGDSVIYDLSSGRVAGVTVEAGATLAFHPDLDTTLETDENVVVLGRLEMRPQAPNNDGWRNSVDNWRPYFIHTLRFVDVDERDFVGGGMDVLASDVGLWVVGGGVLDLVGAQKTGWVRLAGEARTGDTSIQLDRFPVGWRDGDTIVIVPTEHPSVGSRSYKGFEQREITLVNGDTVHFSAPLSHDHPAVTDPFAGNVYTAEVLNLSRNVRIGGTGNGSALPSENGRAHIHITSDQPQTIKYAELSLLGPRKPDGAFTDGVIGRYALHFHMMGEGARSSLVEGVVSRDSGNHTFVVHASHGVTIRDSIAYDNWEDAFWWDGPLVCRDNDTDPNRTNDLLLDRNVVAIIKDDPSFRGFRLSGFVLRHGDNLAIRNSVVIGNRGNKNASGFNWPECGHAVWDFNQGNIAHNNGRDAIFVWQNDSLHHVVEDFVGYNNNGVGIDHGAYGNRYEYMNAHLFGNAGGAIDHHAGFAATGFRPDGYGMAFVNLRTDGALVFKLHKFPFDTPVLYKGCSFTKVVIRDFGGPANSKSNPTRADFVNCVKYRTSQSLEPADFKLESVEPGLDIRVQRPDGTAYQIDDAGNVTPIAPFYETGSGGRGDTEPPSAPSGLTATVVSSTQIDLSWTASTDNVGVAGYHVYRDGSLIAPVSGTDHSDAGLSASTMYIYEVAAIDAADNESARSSSVSATTLADDTDAGDGGSTGGEPSLIYHLAGSQDFNDVDDHIDISPLDVAGSGITIALWLTADSFDGSDMRFVSKALSTSEQDHWWMLSKAGLRNRLRFRLKTEGSTSTLLGLPLQAGVGYQLAATYDGSTMRLYIDGSEVSSMSKSGAVDQDPSVPTWIGANPDGSNFFDGVIRDVRIYDRALSESEVVALYAGG